MCCPRRQGTPWLSKLAVLAQPRYKPFTCVTKLLMWHLVDAFRTAYYLLVFFFKLKNHVTGQMKRVRAPWRWHLWCRRTAAARTCALTSALCLRHRGLHAWPRACFQLFYVYQQHCVEAVAPVTARHGYKDTSTCKISTGRSTPFTLAITQSIDYSPYSSIPHTWHRCQFLHPRGLGLPPASGPSRNPWYRGPLLTDPRSSPGSAPAWLGRTWSGGFGQQKTLLTEPLAWWSGQWMRTKMQDLSF